MSMIDKVSRSLRKRGILGTAYRSVQRLNETARHIAHRREWRKKVGGGSPEERFSRIHQNRYWGDIDSLSGPGSHLASTEQVRAALPALVRQFGIRSIFDAPCGDFFWMNKIRGGMNIDYIGGDIVKAIIADTQRYADDRTTFRHFDITKDAFPKADLWIIRDCFIHLSFADTFRALRQFAGSEIPYMLASTYKVGQDFRNEDIETADVRVIDLFAQPYMLPRDVLYRFDDWNPPWHPREMCMWTREQVAASIKGC